MRPLTFLPMQTTHYTMSVIQSLRMPSLAPAIRILSVCLVVCFLFTTATAEDVKPYPLTTCIVSGDKIDPNVPPIVHNNQQVRLCCKGCIKKFKDCPDKYMVRLQGADADRKKK